MRLLNADIEGAVLVSAGNSFHDLTARMKNERRANSVRARGTSRWPSLVARVARTDTLERLTIRERSSSAEFSSWMSLYMLHTSRSATISWIGRQPSSLRAPEMRSRYPRPVTRRAPKFSLGSVQTCGLQEPAITRFCKWRQTPGTWVRQINPPWTRNAGTGRRQWEQLSPSTWNLGRHRSPNFAQGCQYKRRLHILICVWDLDPSPKSGPNPGSF